MTQEDKDLLLIYLSMALPYGVICFAPDYEYGDIGKLWCVEPFEDLDPPITIQYPKENTINKFCSGIKPYLRSMSSMKDEELSEYRAACRYHNIKGTVIYEDTYKSLDWLNSHHFDYRGLIEKGLALEAPKDMYNIK